MKKDVMEAVGYQRIAVALTSGRRTRGARWIAWRRYLLGYVLSAPALLLVVGVIAYPVADEAWLSLTDATVASSGRFVGLAQYAAIARSPLFWDAAWNTAWFAVVATLGQLALGFVVAALLFGRLPGRRVALLLFLLPWLLPAVLTAIALHLMLNPEVYVVDWLWLSARSRPLADELLAVWPMARMIFISVWRGSGFFGVFLLAGLNQIPSDLLDYADLEGTRGWARLRLVYLPLLRPTIVIALILSLSSTLADFTNQWLLTGGRETTNVLGTLAYETGLNLGQTGRAAAISLALLPFIAALVFGLLRRLEGETT